MRGRSSVSNSTVQRRHSRTSPDEQTLTARGSFSCPGKLAANCKKRSRSNIGSPTTEKKSEEHAPHEEIVPLSGKPYFTFIFSQSHFYFYRMSIPRRFYRVLPRTSVPAFLSYGSRTWEVKYCGQQDFKRFSTGWRKFVADNDIKIGDGCICELIDSKKLHFRMQILRGEVPALASNGGDGQSGQSSDTPIVID